MKIRDFFYLKKIKAYFYDRLIKLMGSVIVFQISQLVHQKESETDKYYCMFL